MNFDHRVTKGGISYFCVGSYSMASYRASEFVRLYQDMRIKCGAGDIKFVCTESHFSH